MPVTEDHPAWLPLEKSRLRVEGFLRDRGAIDGPAIRVMLLGVKDVLAVAPPDSDLRDVVPIHLHDNIAIVGPMTSASGSSPARPCFHCLARRWQLLRSKDERDVLEFGAPVRAVEETPFLAEFPLEVIWRLAQHVASARPVDTSGHPYVFEVRLDTLRVRRYPLLADSDCPLCHVKPADDPGAVVTTLSSRRKPAPDSFRLKEARDYDISVAAYVNPVCGALGLQARHRLECTTTAPTIGHLAVRGDGYMHNSFWGGHAYNYDDSVVLGILEGLERHAGMRPRRVATAVVDTYENLAAEALDPAECGVYTDEFYAGNPYYVRYTPQLKIPWVWGYSLRDKRPLLVPENMTYYHVNRSLNKFLQECSNGCAVGSCIEEAIFFGLLELIERDAFVISWYGKASLPEIDPESCASTATRIMVDRIALYGYDVRLFDTRIEFPVPVVTAVGVRRNGGPGTLCVGAGTNLDPESAVRAALGEIANTIPGFDVHSARETDELREMAGDFDLVTALDDHPRLFGLPEMARHADFLLAGPAPRKPMDDIYRDWNQRRPRGQELLNDLQFCLDRVIAAGFDVIVVDQTSPEQMDAGVRGACVIVPGLIPVDFGWGRQRALHMPRLRSAFRRAGWRSTDLDDTELNRVPHPFP